MKPSAAWATIRAPHGYEPVEGTREVFRIRVGDIRILYSIDDEQHVVRVARVRHRRDVYKS